MSEPEKPKKLQDEIEKNLKRLYDEVAQEEVPDRFRNLLAQLRAADAEKGKSDGRS